MGWHLSDRACLFDLDAVMVTADGGDFVPVDRETAVALCFDRPGGNILSSFQRYTDPKCRELCFVPCIRREAQELLASEIDATEYGWAKPATRWLVEAFRCVRSERAAAQNDRHRAMKAKHAR
jgi:hypothetical protein